MPDTEEHSPEALARRTAVAAFIATLTASAKTAGLYKQGHPTIMAIAERVNNLLLKTLGQETTLTLEIKAKTAVFEESDLEASAEMAAFASSLHTLGVGQVLFTNRMTKEGMYEFFRVLIAKPEDGQSLTDLQKTIQQIRIDGMQMVFILSYVVTGESEKQDQPPGQLSEEQIASFLKAETLPDFIALLLNQAEPLHGKEAETVSGLLDGLLYRETSVEAFDSAMLWSLYDPRIQQRWEEFKTRLAWLPKRRGEPRQKWSRDGLVSWAGVYEDRDVVALKDHHAHEKKDAVRWSLERVRKILGAAAGAPQRKYALLAYTRLLKELGRDGDIRSLLGEHGRWKLMAANPEIAPLYADMRKRIIEKVLSRAMAEQFTTALAKVSEGSSEFGKMCDFGLYFGEPIIGPILEALRGVQEKDHRARVCALLLTLAKTLSFKPLLPGLQDEDWFVVSAVLQVLSDLDDPACVANVAPMLKHGHRKVREAAVKLLAKFGGDAAVEALAGFVAEAAHEEEIPKAVITLSQMTHPKLEAKLVEAYGKTASYESKVAIVNALSRVGTRGSVEFLTEVARRTWYEILSGLNKELRQAARHALEQMRKEGHA